VVRVEEPGRLREVLFFQLGRRHDPVVGPDNAYRRVKVVERDLRDLPRDGVEITSAFTGVAGQDELGSLLDRLEQHLMVKRKRRTNKPLKATEIGLKVGKVLNHFKAGKHFVLDIQDGHFAFARNAKRIQHEERLDGIYIIRTSESKQALSAEDTVRAYKSLGQVEQAFRCIKRLDIRIRPIHHRTVDHVKAHVFLCMLAYYVEWELCRKLAPVRFQDEELHAARWTRDPVAKPQPGEAVQREKRTKQTQDGWPVHSLQTLMDALATRCKNICRVGQGKNAARFTTFTEPTDFQRHIFDLLGLKCG